MAYLAPIHRPTSVRHALKLNFLNEEQECLVVAKANRLEIYEQTFDGLQLRYTKAIYGKVTMLQKIRPTGSPTDYLFVGTDRYTYFTLSWDASLKQLHTEKSYVDQSDKTGRDSQSADRCLIDPTRRFLTLELFEGILTVIPLSHKDKKGQVSLETLGEPTPVRIPELFIRSWTYLYPRKTGVKEKPTLAMLYEDNRQKVRLKLKCLIFSAGAKGELGSADFEDVERDSEDIDPSASHIIPVPGPCYGLLVLAEACVTYINDVSGITKVHPLDEATIFIAWDQVDSKRWILADEFGKLYFLMLVLGGRNGEEVTGFMLDLIGYTSNASVLTYLDAGRVFVGSHRGDSQLVQIGDGSVEVIQTVSNIAPILDFTIMDMGSRTGEGHVNEFSSGQARIVTGSGAFQDGSLRSVRSGVGLEELGSFEIDHIMDLFSLRPDTTTELPHVLVASFVNETRIFVFNPDGEVEESEDFKGLVTSETTLLATNVLDDSFLQCTVTRVRITDSENGMVMAEWTPPTGASISAASAHDSHVALSIGGTEIVVLDINADLRVAACKKFGAASQISCVELSSILPGICIVGHWKNANVSILRLDTLQEISTTQVGGDVTAIPRSILVTQILPKENPTLFIALADGNIVTFSIDESKYSLTGQKSTILGTQQANLRALPRGDGLFNVFATCEHPSLIYGSEGRIVYSAITAEKASCICRFNAEAFPGAIAIATPTDLRIAIVDTERTTHVQTLPVGETVRRIAYSAKLKTFGLGTIKRILKSGVEIVQSHFKLADEVVFKELDTYELKEDELVESVIRADLDEGSGQLVERFVVGTSYIEDAQPDAIRGRILVFEVTQDRLLKVVTQLAVKGACRALGVIRGQLVAALVKTVVVYAFEYGALKRKATFRTSTAPIDISVSAGVIAIADIMKSVSIVYYKEGESGEPGRLDEVARHFETAWSTAVAPVGNNAFLESDAEGNLIVLNRNVNGVTADDKRRLEVTSAIQLGEMVNRIRPIDIPTTSTAIVVPRAFLATVEGSIYLFGLIVPEKQNLLISLQDKLATFVQSPGLYPFNKFRAFKNAVRESEEPFRFVDGELIEMFLQCGTAMQEEIVKGLDVQVEEVKSMVETLRRMH